MNDVCSPAAAATVPIRATEVHRPADRDRHCERRCGRRGVPGRPPMDAGTTCPAPVAAPPQPRPSHVRPVSHLSHLLPALRVYGFRILPHGHGVSGPTWPDPHVSCAARDRHPRIRGARVQARKDGKPHGRPMTAGKLLPEMKQLRKGGLSKREIAKRLGVSRTSVIRWLRPKKRS